MKFCEKCGAELLDDAIMCPKCGNPIKKPQKPVYKKWWFWVIVVVLFFMFIGLAADNEEASNANVTTTETSTTSPTVNNKKEENTIPKEFSEKMPCFCISKY